VSLGKVPKVSRNKPPIVSATSESKEIFKKSFKSDRVSNPLTI